MQGIGDVPDLVDALFHTKQNTQPIVIRLQYSAALPKQTQKYIR